MGLPARMLLVWTLVGQGVPVLAATDPALAGLMSRNDRLRVLIKKIEAPVKIEDESLQSWARDAFSHESLGGPTDRESFGERRALLARMAADSRLARLAGLEPGEISRGLEQAGAGADEVSWSHVDMLLDSIWCREVSSVGRPAGPVTPTRDAAPVTTSTWTLPYAVGIVVLTLTLLGVAFAGRPREEAPARAIGSRPASASRSGDFTSPMSVAPAAARPGVPAGPARGPGPAGVGPPAAGPAPGRLPGDAASILPGIVERTPAAPRKLKYREGLQLRRPGEGAPGPGPPAGEIFPALPEAPPPGPSPEPLSEPPRAFSTEPDLSRMVPRPPPTPPPPAPPPAGVAPAHPPGEVTVSLTGPAWTPRPEGPRTTSKLPVAATPTPPPAAPGPPGVPGPELVAGSKPAPPPPPVAPAILPVAPPPPSEVFSAVKDLVREPSGSHQIELPQGMFPDRYEVQAMLGRGGMGVVYKARDTRSGKTVAIKTLLNAAMASATSKERFLREFQAMVSLDHEGIVKVFDIGQREALYFVMEFIEASDLGSMLVEETFPVTRSLDVAIQLAGALAYAHSRGVTHRDLKPGNILVTRESKIKIVDFGLAKLENASTITQAGTILGSLRFMAPEQLTGENIDHRADIYGIGSTLYYMLSGTTPHEGQPPPAKLTRPPDPILRHEPTLDPRLAEAVMRCLALDPGDRFQTAGELENSLRSCRRAGASRRG